MLGHDAGPPAQNDPGKQGTNQGISQTDPGGGNAVFPAELSGIADKNNGGKVRSTIGKSSKPGADTSSTQYESVDIGCIFTAVKADGNHNCEKACKH